MSEFFYLIPLSLGLGVLGLVVFLWTLKGGQYDDLAGAAERILFERERGPVRHSQVPPAPGSGANTESGWKKG